MIPCKLGPFSELINESFYALHAWIVPIISRIVKIYSSHYVRRIGLIFSALWARIFTSLNRMHKETNSATTDMLLPISGRSGSCLATSISTNGPPAMAKPYIDEAFVIDKTVCSALGTKNVL